MRIGVDLGGSHISIAKVENGKIINESYHLITNKDKINIEEAIETNIIRYIKKMIETTNEKIEFIGIAVPGAVTETKIIKCVNLGIKDYEVAKAINNKLIKYATQNYVEDRFESLPLQIKLQNDAKCAAIAEKQYGVLRDYNDTLFLTLGTGIGGAAIINGKLLEGKQFLGCEFGHMTIDVNGENCKCGKKGCFELYGSMRKFKEKLNEELELSVSKNSNELYDLLKEDIETERHDERIKKVIDGYIENLAIGISNLINIFEPEAIGIGGSFAYFEEFLLEKLKEKILKGNLLFNPRSDIIIKSAILKNDAGIIGASML